MSVIGTWVSFLSASHHVCVLRLEYHPCLSVSSYLCIEIRISSVHQSHYVCVLSLLGANKWPSKGYMVHFPEQRYGGCKSCFVFPELSSKFFVCFSALPHLLCAGNGVVRIACFVICFASCTLLWLFRFAFCLVCYLFCCMSCHCFIFVLPFTSFLVLLVFFCLLSIQEENEFLDVCASCTTLILMQVFLERTQIKIPWLVYKWVLQYRTIQGTRTRALLMAWGTDKECSVVSEKNETYLV